MCIIYTENLKYGKEQLVLVFLMQQMITFLYVLGNTIKVLNNMAVKVKMAKKEVMGYKFKNFKLFNQIRLLTEQFKYQNQIQINSLVNYLINLYKF